MGSCAHFTYGDAHLSLLYLPRTNCVTWGWVYTGGRISAIRIQWKNFLAISTERWYFDNVWQMLYFCGKL